MSDLSININNMRKFFLVFCIILSVAAVIFALATRLFWSNQSNNNFVTFEKGIVVSIPKENEVISSPLKIEGYVNGDGWVGFEGQVGVVRLFDENDKELGLAILTADGEWMQTKINFKTTLWFDYPGEGQGKLVFYNENPSGESEKNKTFTLSVKLQKSSSAKTIFNVYFGYPHDLEQSCDLVLPFKREVPKTQAVAKSALEELLKGPSSQEIYAGYATSINPGVKVQSLIIENGVAKVDFSEELDKNVAGSCRVLAIKAQITETLRQFSTVKSVVISVDGRVEDILQP